jgi:hypothetical protein
MAEKTKVYDLGEVTCNFLGIPLDAMGGWGEGSGGIECEKADPSFTIKRGADGSVVRSKTYSNVWMVKLVILQTAAINAVLSAILIEDEKATNGAGVGPLLVRDRQGLSVIAGSSCWIEGHPKTIKFGAEQSNNEWTIVVANGTAFVGGN